ncbi:pancreatic adenocarcinoma up-regulated factor [Tamandua tetradactyla]|uniref:pancreatic adenocarcinoma up-regulated factor n=1 Tax=Tamandua tetradactyla TaxID=48850 RepID=UPI0040542287
MLLLLLLPLALLGGSVCRAQQMFGLGGGKYFSTSEDNENDVTGIRVCVSVFGLIKSFQLKFGSTWSAKYCVPCDKYQEFLLWPGEDFVSAYGTYRLFLRYLILSTSFGRTAMFGSDGGQGFSASPSRNGQVVTGLFGQCKALGISGLGFRWDYPLLEPTSPQPTTGTENTNP